MVMHTQSLQSTPSQSTPVPLDSVHKGEVPACLYLTLDDQLAQYIEQVFVQAVAVKALRICSVSPAQYLDALVEHCTEFGAPRMVMLDVSQLCNDINDGAAEHVEKAEYVIRQLAQSPLFTHTLIIAIGTLDSAMYYRQLRNAGVHEYLIAPVEFDTLLMTVMSALSTPELVSPAAFPFEHDHELPSSVSTELGQRIAMASAKGSAGCTTILANLAWVLSQQGCAKEAANVACADLDFVSGDLDLHFDITANNRLLEMLEFPERLEPLVFERSCVKVTENLSVLMGYHTHLEQEFWPDLPALEATSQFCQQQAAHVLWDIPSYSLRDRVGFGALVNADVRIVVMAPTLSSIRHTQQLLALLPEQAHQRTLLILNHTKPEKVSLISPTDVAQAMGRQPDLIVPYCPEKMLAAATMGRPVAAENMRLKKLFVQLAEKVQGDNRASASRLSRWLRRG